MHQCSQGCGALFNCHEALGAVCRFHIKKAQTTYSHVK